MAKKEYLKMADVFPFGTIIDTDRHYNGWAVIQAKDKNGNTATIDESGDGGFYEKTAKYISHAINSHDELVAEVERLRNALSVAASAFDKLQLKEYGKNSFMVSRREMKEFAAHHSSVATAALNHDK